MTPSESWFISGVVGLITIAVFLLANAIGEVNRRVSELEKRCGKEESSWS